MRVEQAKQDQKKIEALLLRKMFGNNSIWQYIERALLRYVQRFIEIINDDISLMKLNSFQPEMDLKILVSIVILDMKMTKAMIRVDLSEPNEAKEIILVDREENSWKHFSFLYSRTFLLLLIYLLMT